MSIDVYPTPADVTLGTMSTQNANAVAITGGSATLNGNLYVGTVYAAGYLAAIYAGGSGLVMRSSAADGSVYLVGFHNQAGGHVGSISCSSTTTAYNTSSDVRLKHSIEKLVGALGVVQLLNPISFLWKADNSPGVGFRADELQQVIPEAVMGEVGALNEDGSIRPQQVDLSKLVPWLTAALQETIAQVQTLTARVAELEAAML